MRKIRGYKVSTVIGGFSCYAGETLQELADSIEQVVCLQDADIGDEITIKVVENTQEEIDAMSDL